MTRVRSLLVLVLVVAAAAAAMVAAPPAVAAPAAATQPPTAVVVLGDSAASGEGAGDYEQGTRGENGNWCHRSVHAYVHRTGLAQTSVNLACSGADTTHVRFGSAVQHTEGSQAERLVEVARTSRVTTVILQVGANDDAALTGTGIACIRAFIDPREPPCRQTLDPLVPQRMAATAPKVEAAVRDVREAMRRAGYPESRYELVLASYAAPITEHMLPLQAALGCPYSRPDAGWGRTVLFPALSRDDPARGRGHRRPVPRHGPGHRGLRGLHETRAQTRSGSGASPSSPRRWSTAASTRSATTWPRSRSTRRRSRTRRWGGASASSCAAGPPLPPAWRAATAGRTWSRRLRRRPRPRSGCGSEHQRRPVHQRRLHQRHSTTRSRGRWFRRSQPPSVTTTMSSMRAPHSPSR